MIWLLPLAAVLGLAGYIGIRTYINESGETELTLDAGLPAADTTAVVSAIGTSTDPNALIALAQKYSAYPYTSYELALRAWELGGKSGSPPAPPAGPGVSTPPGLPAAPSPPATKTVDAPQAVAPAPPIQPATPPSFMDELQELAAQAAAAAGGMLGTQTAPPASAPAASVYAGNAAAVGAGPGWALQPADGPVSYMWVPPPESATASGPVADEIQRLSAAKLSGMLIEQAPDGSVWMFAGADGVVIPSLGKLPAGATPPPPPTPAPPEPAPAPSPEPPLPPAGTGPIPVDQPPPHPPTSQASGAVPTAPVGRATPVLRIRPGDRVWPRTVAQIGTGVRRGAPGSLEHLIDINPHLAPDGVLREFVPGDAVNIPQSWAPALKSKGFHVEGLVEMDQKLGPAQGGERE